MNLFKKIKLFYYKKKILRAISYSEQKHGSIGVSEREMIEEFSRESKKTIFISQELNKTAKKLKKGDEKSKAYKPYIDRQLYRILKEAEKNKIGSEEIFKGYIPNKEIGEKIIHNLKIKLIMPIVLFGLAVVGLDTVRVLYVRILEDAHKTLENPLKFITENYYYLMGAFAVFIIFLFISIPEKLPLLKNIFTKVESLMVLSLISTMHKMGYQAEAIKKSIVSVFSIKVKEKFSYASEIDALVDILKKKNYLNEEESAFLRVYVKRNKVMEGVANIAKLKKEEIFLINGIVEEIINKIGLMLLTIPILTIILLMKEVLNAVGDKITP